MNEDKSAGASYKGSKPGRKRKHLPVSEDLHRIHLNLIFINIYVHWPECKPVKSEVFIGY